ncbi:penicillin acylase family protein [Sediminivirga luteola]|uniref:Penicillin amidase n=1 Tax=Sediminivirga luteola TaxID=1774748 RepID=A0A8J2XI55_9MICO|nr:penicillin acylase family protein [Sediminivirga luteola]GGA16311.1 penicillin amidase [Sediminivirga luteola]
MTGTAEREQHTLEGIDGEVEVVYDRWGVPHIRASSAEDVFTAQGFIAARDRLFQLDLFRRRGLGLLSEALGPAYAEQDRAARLFRYRGDMRAEWNSYGPDAKRIATCFVAGINAWIAATEENPELLGPDFQAAGFTPGRWRPEDLCLIRSHGLYGNVEKELTRAITLHRWGAGAEDLRAVREPGPPAPVPEGLDLSVFHQAVLDDYRLACAPVTFGAGAGRPVGGREREPDGSNNWVVGPELTATGRPHLANDPHRAMSLPSLRYISHLRCPEFDVIGAGEPALPGVSIGHNGNVAFGLTIFPIDQEDLYVYELHPDAPGLYRYRGQWRPFDEVHEDIPVRGEDARAVTLRFSCHGPVVRIEPENRVAFAVRAAWLEPGMAPYLGSIRYMRARDTREFRDAMMAWGAPGENQVYADVSGDFGWIPGGLVPIREGWDGSLPVPGDGRYEWSGFRQGDELPSRHNPQEGWFASANQYNLPEPAGGAAQVHITQDWMSPFRYRRAAEVLGSVTAERRWTMADTVRLQNDDLSVPAREAVGALGALLPLEGRGADVPGAGAPGDSTGSGMAEARAAEAAGGPGERAVAASWERLPEAADARAALALFGVGEEHPWDGRMRADAPQPILYERWFSLLRPALQEWRLSSALGTAAREAAAQLAPAPLALGDPRPVLRLLREALAVDDGRAIVAGTLAAAYRQLHAELGPPEEPAWHWGRHHVMRFAHPLAGLPDAPGWAVLDERPRPGSGDTVGLSGYDPGTRPGRQHIGASFRIAIDVGSWDDSRAVNAPGQSGDPRSEHYADLVDVWDADDVFPLCYSEEAIEQHREHTVRLLPG